MRGVAADGPEECRSSPHSTGPSGPRPGSRGSGTASAAAAPASPPASGFQAHDHVEVWSDGANAWLDGSVEEVFETERVLDGYALPAGSVKVSCAGAVKYVPPAQLATTLRRPGGGSSAVRADGRSPPPRRSGSMGPPRTRPAARSRCSSERLEARDRWNTHELYIQELFSAFDRDDSGQLEPEEFRRLLHQFNDKQVVSEQELNFMLSVADVDRNGAISLAELHYALRAWHSYRHLDDSVLSLFAEFDVDESGRLDVEELKDLLTAMNGGTPVPRQEVQYVMERGDERGDGAVNRSELLGAIATWYMHVDRNRTDLQTLLQEALARSSKEDQSEVAESAKSWGHFASMLPWSRGYLAVQQDCEHGADLAGGGRGSRRAASASASGTHSTTGADGGAAANDKNWLLKLLMRMCRVFCYVGFPFIFGLVLACSGWKFRVNKCPRNLDGLLLWFGSLACLLGALAYVRGASPMASRIRLATVVALSLLDLVGFLWSRDPEVQKHKSQCGHVLVYWSLLLWSVIPFVAAAYAVYYLAAHVRRLRQHDEALQHDCVTSAASS